MSSIVSFGVPSVVEVNRQWSKADKDEQGLNVRSHRAVRDADDAVVGCSMFGAVRTFFICC